MEQIPFLRERKATLDDNAPGTAEGRPQDDAREPRDPGKPAKTTAEYAETFEKAVDIAEKALRFAPFPRP